MNNLKRSLDRAIHLLNTPAIYEDYISIKIKPVEGGCCCFNHWPRTWADFNEYISPCGPLENEGAVLIDKNNEKFVLECHESGPEIIVYLEFGTAVIALIATLLKYRQKETHNFSLKFKTTTRRWINGQIEENSIEIGLNLFDDSKEKKISESPRNEKAPKRKKGKKK